MTRAKSSNDTPMRGFEIDDDDASTLQRAEKLGWKLADVHAEYHTHQNEKDVAARLEAVSKRFSVLVEDVLSLAFEANKKGTRESANLTAFFVKSDVYETVTNREKKTGKGGYSGAQSGTAM